MWKLFDFNSDGKTSLFEKVVGIELLESIIHDENDENATIDESESNDDETEEDDFDEIADDDDDFEDEDEF